MLTVQPASVGGQQRWELADGSTLYDVTHLRCRSALYTPAKAGGSCSPKAAREDDFPRVSRRGDAAGRQLREARLPSADRDRRSQERLSSR